MNIRVLPPDVQQRIAAGEVVERPASVLKELIENALDAGAQNVCVDVQEGGRRLIRVTDDGCGIDPGEVPLAFERFATSKISCVDDLASLRSFGLRGEALASIASVSRVRVLTRTRDSLLGTEARLEGGRVVSLGEAGAPIGTRFEVWDLFYNTPARQKFLRSLKTEYGHILRVFTDFALAFPDKYFSLTMDGRELHGFPSTTAAERVAAVFGQQAASQLEEFDEIGAWGRIWGFAMTGDAIGQRRVYLYVNQRPVRSPILQRAVTEGLDGMQGLVVLFVDAHAAEVDVNVHPAKTEVRFRQPHDVYERVRHALKRRTRAFNSPYLKAAEDGADYNALDFKLLGQVEDTFLLLLHDGHVYFLDQHAAEECVFVERLRQGKAGRRDLIAPQIVTLTDEERAFIDTHAEAIAACGFGIESFGPSVAALRTIPEMVSPKDSARVFSQMLARARSGREDFAQALSCLSAVKAGVSLERERQERLVADWRRTANPHACAHNRPVYHRVALDEVRRKVGRTGLSCEFDQKNHNHVCLSGETQNVE